MKSHPHKQQKRLTLGRRLLGVVLILSALILSAMIGFQYNQTLNRSIEQLTERFSQQESVVQEPLLSRLIDAIHTDEKAVIDHAMKDLLSIQPVETIRLERAHHSDIAVGDASAEDVMIKSFDIEDRSHTHGSHNAHLSIHLNMQPIRNAALITALRKVLPTATVLAVILIALYVTCHTLLTRRLQALVRLVDAYHQSLTSSQAASHSAVLSDGPRDEIHSIATGLHKLRSRLENSYAILHEQESNYHRLLECAGEGIYGFTSDGVVTFANPAALKMLGYSEEEILGRDSHSLIHHTRTDGSAYPAEECMMRKALLQKEPVYVDHEILWRKDGSHFPVQYTATPILENEQPTGVVVTFRDMSEERRINELLITLSEGVTHQVGEAFFEALTFKIADVFEVKYAFIGLLNEEKNQVSTITVVANHQLTDNITYDLVDTPCDNVINSEACFHESEIQHLYPKDVLLKKMQVESYAAAPIRTADGETLGVLAILDDVPLTFAEQKLNILKIFATRISTELVRQKAEEQQRLAAITFDTHESIAITDAQGTIIRVNKSFTDTTGYSEAEAIGNNMSMLRSGKHDKNFYREMWQQISAEGFWQGEIWNRRKSGQIYPEWLNITAVKNHRGLVTHYVSSFLDITERKQAEALIEKIAFYDSLTGLPNRRLLTDRIEQSLSRAERQGRYGALIVLDIDYFQNINESFGHSVGDAILTHVADVLSQAVRTYDTVARTSGDEFVVLLPELDEAEEKAAKDAQVIAGKVLNGLSKPFTIEQTDFHLSASLGIAMFPKAGSTPSQILKEADTALYRAKTLGRNNIQFFIPAMQEKVERKMRLQTELHSAIANDELAMYLQPQVDSHGRIISAEALIRWRHPKSGLIPPFEFIPIAEETGLIIEIGQWILRKAIAQLMSLGTSSNGNPLNHIAVNVSPVQFYDPNFVTMVEDIINESGVDPKLVELEITEGILVHDINDTIEKMTKLRKLGVRLSIDDFGTGYSSLSYLRHLPLNKLKIDQSFVKGIDKDDNNKAIVETVISLANNLKLSLIAEGVETEQERDVLLSYGCKNFQGYLFSKPLPQEQFMELISQQHEKKETYQSENENIEKTENVVPFINERRS